MGVNLSLKRPVCPRPRVTNSQRTPRQFTGLGGPTLFRTLRSLFGTPSFDSRFPVSRTQDSEEVDTTPVSTRSLVPCRRTLTGDMNCFCVLRCSSRHSYLPLLPLPVVPNISWTFLLVRNSTALSGLGSQTSTIVDSLF